MKEKKEYPKAPEPEGIGIKGHYGPEIINLPKQSAIVQMRLNSVTKNVSRDRIEEMKGKGWVLI